MLFESISNFFIDGLEFFAVATPWGIEFNENVSELLCDFGEVVVSEDQDIAFFSPCEGA